MLTVRVVLFGHLKDVFPRGEASLSLPDGATTTDAADALAAQDTRLSDLLVKTRVAVREEFADADTVLRDGDEVAFLPPMSGG
ncbi:MAG: MoaD/ThiS family protein [Akkermansiaceae bacterium]|nr:MoaD/ThiS family protein [Armatimonadota bacterium]